MTTSFARKLGLVLVLSVTGSFLGGCYVRTARPCRTECHWHRGHKVCDRVCR
jgi:hypothetical protein